MRSVIVRAQELGGRWVTLGSESARGIVVEDLTADADEWGSRSCSFKLRRRIDVPWPDIGAYAPLEIEDQGLPIWSGRVKGTPTSDESDRLITVNGEGWQYHLDDDALRKLYVDSKLSNWFDSRTKLTAVLGTGGFTVGGTAQSDQGGALLFGFPKGYVAAVNDVAGFEYDAGEGSLINDVSFTLVSSNNNGGNVIFRCYYSTDNITYTLILSRFLDSTVPPFVGPGPINFDLTGTIPAPGARYLAVQVQCLAAFTLPADAYVQMQSCNVYASDAYSTSGFSVLKASDVVQDALANGTLLLSRSTSKITTTAFNIPDFAPTTPVTPRELMSSVNAYHDYRIRVGPDKLLEFGPKPSAPLIMVDERASFDEASSGDASEIYSDALVSYTDPAGKQQIMRRSQPASNFLVSAIQPTNPSFATNASNWGGFSVSRDTVVFDTTPASLKMATASFGLASAQTSAWTGSAFVPGSVYQLAFSVRTDYAGGATFSASMTDANGVVVGSASVFAAQNTWTPVTMPFTPQTNGTPFFTLLASGAPTTAFAWIDSLVIYEASVTIVDRRGFRRTKVLDTNMALSGVAAQQIADTLLASKKTTPLKGKLAVGGYGTARNAKNGQSMTPSELLLNTGELVRLMHLVDPDTGALCREGRIVSVSWDAVQDAATVEIDSQSQNFEAMISRLAVVTGQVPG